MAQLKIGKLEGTASRPQYGTGTPIKRKAAYGQREINRMIEAAQQFELL